MSEAMDKPLMQEEERLLEIEDPWCFECNNYADECICEELKKESECAETDV